MRASPWMASLRAVAWLVLLAGCRRYLELLRVPADLGAEDPAAAALVAGRYLADAVWWYLVALTGMTAVVHAVHVVRGTGRAALPLPGGAAMARAVAGLGVGLTAVAASPPAEAAAPPPTLHREPAESAPAPDPPAAPNTHTVVAGDSFWTIAEGVVARRLGRPPSDIETADYWLRLVDANLDRLPDASDPDLIHPGQVFVLPPAT